MKNLFSKVIFADTNVDHQSDLVPSKRHASSSNFQWFLFSHLDLTFRKAGGQSFRICAGEEHLGAFLVLQKI